MTDLDVRAVVAWYQAGRSIGRPDMTARHLNRELLTYDPQIVVSDTAAEQQSVMELFSGFIGVFKNPHSHRFLEIKDPLTAFEILSFANHLLNLVVSISGKASP